MPHFECRCGHTILVNPPSQAAGYLVWDHDVDLSMASRRSEVHGFLQAITTGQRQAFCGTSMDHLKRQNDCR